VGRRAAAGAGRGVGCGLHRARGVAPAAGRLCARACKPLSLHSFLFSSRVVSAQGKLDDQYRIILGAKMYDKWFPDGVPLEAARD